MNTHTTHTLLAETIQIGKILFASGLFKELENEEQAVAIILRGQELGIQPVASLMKGKTLVAAPCHDATSPKSNAQHISDLLNELGVVELAARRSVATQYLGARKAADLSQKELEEALAAIREAYTPEEEAAEEVETVVVEDDTEPIQTPESAAIPSTIKASDEDEPTTARAAISVALDRAGITDADCRQSIVKKQLLAVRRRKVESLTPEELATVVEGIAAAA
ncbi:hypothetical protein PN498_26440 [Oscillatoria sp. CS-180]|uniref:hypothetical protein n=1 Tax=Oscillatoria sp. CS-180 TaxID=3021720 RepID=UPI00232BF85A|nr:hypothetical protein [Oscillatoria sp. CS-180]MDB9529557.1 hypothetical protein [Oscillatoria sp. CS-180]